MERLFNNQIQPQAQPLNSFIRPQQFQRPNASQQPLLGAVSKIATLQQAGTSSVAGFNEFEQVANALAPLSKDLVSLTDKGFKYYAKSNIEAGYYEELENQRVRSQLQVQRNQEQGAAEAAQLQTQLAKTDPVAESLFREANPWRAVGRRRALAQLAAGQVSAVLNADLANNAGTLGSMKPGSPELLQRKQQLTQDIYQRFGLQGNEPEATFYVTPQVNKSWDQYTQKQSELYTEELHESSIALTNAAVAEGALKWLTSGIELPTGARLLPGQEGFDQAVALKLTQFIDNGLDLLGGKDKVEAWKRIQKTLGFIRANYPQISSAIQQVRTGPSSMAYEKRPMFGNSNPIELQQMTTQAIQSRNQAYTADQSAKEDSLEQLWIAPDGPGSVPVDSEEFKNRLAPFQVKADNMGFGNTAGWVQRKVNEARSAAMATFNPSSLMLGEFEQSLMNLTPADLQGANYAKVIERANQVAASFPTQEQQVKKMEEYSRIIRERREQLAKMPTGAALQGNLSRFVTEDLKDPQIDKLRNGAKFDPLSFAIAQAAGQSTGAALGEQKRYQTYANGLRGLYQVWIDNERQAWLNANPGRTQIPQGELAVLMRTAVQKARQTQEYKDLKARALGPQSQPQSNGPTRLPTQPSGGNNSNTNPSNGPVPQAAANTIPKNVARQYNQRAVMQPTWIRSELARLANNRPVTKDLYDLANKAGTSTDRYLLEQLRFYPQLDPTGENRKELQRRINNTRSSTTPASSNYAYAVNPRPANYNPRSPGAWLTSIYFPAQPA
jgi:hypothetical protein